MPADRKKKILQEIKKKNFPLALTMIDHALGDEPDDPELLYNFGVCCFRTGNFKKSIAVMEDILLKFPRFIERDNIYRIIIYSHINTKEYNRAMEIANERLKLNVGDLRLLSFKAHILEKQGKIPEAIDTHKQILRINPEYKNSLNSVGFLLVTKPGATQNELSLATECLKKILKDSPENPAYLDSFAVLLGKKGNREAAIKALKKALYYLPSNGEILDHLEELIKETPKISKV